MKTGRLWLLTFDCIELARSGKAGIAQTAPLARTRLANAPIGQRGIESRRGLGDLGSAPSGFALSNDRLRRLSASLAAVQAARETLDRSVYFVRAGGGRQRPAHP